MLNLGSLALDYYYPLCYIIGLPGGSAVKNPPVNAGDVSSIPGSRRSPGEGNGNPFLPGDMDREAWWAMGSQRVGHDLATRQQKCK